MPKSWIIKVLGVFAGAILLLVTPRIPQSEHYHQFVADITWLGVNNAMNVFSNLGFVLVGLWGWLKLKAKTRAIKSLLLSFMAIGFGSAYYHLNPNVHTLLWDRLPMAWAFAQILLLLTKDFVSPQKADNWTKGLTALYLSSVLMWYFTELMGYSDLRLYIMAQGLPMVLLPVFVAKNRFKKSRVWIVSALMFYLAAKGFEFADGAFFEFSGLLGGHPIKHVLSAAAMASIIGHIKVNEAWKVSYSNLSKCKNVGSLASFP